MIDGALIGLVAGVGMLLIWRACWIPEPRPAARAPGRWERWRQLLRDDLAQVGLGTVPPTAVPALSAGFAAAVGVVLWSVSEAVVPALTVALVISAVPTIVLHTAARRQRVRLRDLWPEAVDQITSAIRAGLSLPEALSQLGERGPEELRDPFLEFGRDFQASGDFSASLDRLKARMADPVADRIVEALRITRDVGGTDLGLLLRTLSAFLREDARTRQELEARQSWTVNAAKLALAAPWIVLGLISTRPQAAQAYDSPQGLMLILVGGGVSLVAYRVMLQIARLPQDDRVLR